MFAEFCDSCGNPIGIDVGQMAHGSQHWHANDKCFSCSNCGISLIGQPFLPKNGEIFCSSGCSRGIPPTEPVNPKYPPRSATRISSSRPPDMSKIKDGYFSSTSTMSPQPVRKVVEVSSSSRTSYRSSLDKYGLAAAEKLGYSFKNIPQNIIEESDRDEISSTCSTLSSRKKELPAFPPSSKYTEKPVLRVPPSYRQKPSGSEIWIDMVPSKNETTRQRVEDNAHEHFYSKEFETNNNFSLHEKRSHRNKKQEDNYFSDYEVERRKRSQRKHQYKPIVYDTETPVKSLGLATQPTITKHRSSESIHARRDMNAIHDENVVRTKTKSETNLTHSNSYKTKNDALANLRYGIDVSTPNKKNNKNNIEPVKRSVSQRSDLTKKQRSFGMLSAEDQQRTRIAYVTQDDMAMANVQKSPTKIKRKGNKNQQCVIS